MGDEAEQAGHRVSVELAVVHVSSVWIGILVSI
jgi:hypothetical protein